MLKMMFLKNICFVKFLRKLCNIATLGSMGSRISCICTHCLNNNTELRILLQGFAFVPEQYNMKNNLSHVVLNSHLLQQQELSRVE